VGRLYKCAGTQTPKPNMLDGHLLWDNQEARVTVSVLHQETACIWRAVCGTAVLESTKFSMTKASMPEQK
jgi:hypothetical protein